MVDTNDVLFSESRQIQVSSEYQALLLKLDKLLGETLLSNNEVLRYLLDLWTWFSIQQVQPATVSKSIDNGDENLAATPMLIRVKDGLKVRDYGDGLITSIGEDYGSYSTGSLLRTVRFMLESLEKRGAESVIFAGSIQAQRFAWIECELRGIKHSFFPSSKDIGIERRVKRILAN